MARVKRAVNAQKKKRKVMKLAKGYFGAKSKQYRAASEQVRRSLRYAYIGRKLKKRNFRSLWIARINAAARINGLSYSRTVSYTHLDVYKRQVSNMPPRARRHVPATRKRRAATARPSSPPCMNCAPPATRPSCSSPAMCGPIPATAKCSSA